MTSSRVERIAFDGDSLKAWAELDPKAINWPVVYTIDGERRIYVGETIHLLTRMRQHLARPDRNHLTSVRVVIDETFNKSVCLDLESFLIQRFAGDGKYQVENANAGLTGSDYYERRRYREQFVEIFDQLRAEGLFEHTIHQIENSDLFKLSPFKELNYDQRVAIMGMLDRLFADLRADARSTAVVQGQPGTGKTIVGIYLMKLLSDIRRGAELIDTESDAIFAGFFTEENAALLQDFRMGFVVPQQSLRRTVEKVFAKTSGLSKDMVLSPFQVGESSAEFDLLIVDEAHRLQQLAATMAMSILKFKAINRRLFNGHEAGGNQLDWIRLTSRHQILLVDGEQSIRPAFDLPSEVLQALERDAAETGRLYALKSQMRVRAGEDYVAYVRGFLSSNPPAPVAFADYDLRLFDNLGVMKHAILQREREFGLSRLVAGFAWKWRSKKDKSQYDIEIDGQRLQWNNSATDWINSPTSINEVGSIHTTQGYDLNYAGVIIGPDLSYDPVDRRLRFHRDSYYDTKGKLNNKMLGITFDDEDLLTAVRNIYAVLLTRGIRGTYVYVCDPELRRYLAKFIPERSGAGAAMPDVVHPSREVPEGSQLEVELGASAASDSPSGVPSSRHDQGDRGHWSNARLDRP
ncbi:DNA/RNA helicase domain-containing protein [Aeromicrobium sp.]|uniref:DNA/RNA helicase domain-containing protein n=1 Tax=Aeromicrobium sp. TaxID=1871063 RepID=UPI0030C22D87